MKQIIAGVSGVASLALLGYIASRQNGHARSKRAIEFDDEIIEKYDFEGENSTLTEKEQWIAFLKDINIDATQDVLEKVAQVSYNGNFANMRQFSRGEYASVHDAMILENNKRLSEGGEWAEAIRSTIQQGATYKAAAGESGNCEWSASESVADEDGCVKTNGFEFTSPHIQNQIQAAGCDDADYVPYTADDNTNLWFLVPRAIPLWAKDESSHVNDWAEYFTLIKSMTSKWWVRNHDGIIRLSVGLYLNGVQMIPRGVKMSRRDPLARLNRWYSKPSISAAKPGFYKTLKTVSESMGVGAYVRNSANGVLEGTRESKDNCYFLMFIQDIPYDLNTIHVRTQEGSRKRTGDFFDQINSVCTATYAFVMPGARDSESAAGKFIDQFELIAFPKRQEFFPYDPDFSGIYRLENYQEVSSQAFEDHLRMGMCMHAKRQQCKLAQKGAVVEPTVAEYDLEYYEEDSYANDYAAYDNSEVDYESPTDEPYYEMKSLDEPEEKEEVAPQPQCCGANIYISQFNNVIKMCLYDYQALQGKVTARGESGGMDYSSVYDYNSDYQYKK
jgi:hypothetical protein